MVAHEKGMVNGALALLRHTNYKINLAGHFKIKREINPKYARLCSDKVLMTRFLFGDDVSQSARQIDESESSRTIFQTRNLSLLEICSWELGRLEASLGKPSTGGFLPGFNPMAPERLVTRGTRDTPIHGRKLIKKKNSQGWSHSTPWQ